jgi:prophage antirepressor-like protein
MTDQNQKIALFEEKKIRKIRHNDEWYFSVVDVVEALTESPEPRKYRSVLKLRMQSESDIEPTTICSQLKMLAKD